MPTTFQDLPATKIKAHPRNPRGDVGDVGELAASIATKGILEPLIVIPDPAAAGDGSFLLIAGHRRLAAAQQAKVKTVPCLVRDDLDDEVQQIEAMLVENLQRTDLTVVEEARAYQQLLEFPGYTVKKITTTTGRAATTVKQRLALTKLDAARLASISSGQTTLAEAAVFVEFADDKEATKDLAAAQGTSNWNYRVEGARSRRQRQQLVDGLRKQHPGVPITTGWPGQVFARLGVEPTAEQLAEHADCGDQLVINCGYTSNEAIWVCLNQAHAGVVGATDSGDSEGSGDGTPSGPAVVGSRQAHKDAEEAAAHEAAEQLDADLAVAATVRRAFLFEVIHAPTQEHEAIARRYGQDMIMDDETGDRPDKLTIVQALLLQLVLSYTEVESKLVNKGKAGWLNGDNRMTYLDRETRSWWATLEQLGYGWSDLERTLIAEAGPAGEDD